MSLCENEWDEDKKNEFGYLDYVDFRFFDFNKIIILLFLRFVIVV